MWFRQILSHLKTICRIQFETLRWILNIISAALRNLSSLYRKQGRIEAADILEKAAKGSKGEKQGIQGKEFIIFKTKNVSKIGHIFDNDKNRFEPRVK